MRPTSKDGCRDWASERRTGYFSVRYSRALIGLSAYARGQVIFSCVCSVRIVGLGGVDTPDRECTCGGKREN